MYQNRILSVSGAVLFCIGLAGCSGEPSSSDIEKAIKANVDQANQQAKTMGGGLFSDDMLTVVHEVKKVGCAEAEGAAGYKCDVEVDVSAPFVGRTKNVAALRFVEASDGWQVAQ